MTDGIKYHDTDGDGIFAMSEANKAIDDICAENNWPKATVQQRQAIWQLFDENSDGSICFQEYCNNTDAIKKISEILSFSKITKRMFIEDLLIEAQEKYFNDLSFEMDTKMLQKVFNDVICPSLGIKKQTMDQSDTIMCGCNEIKGVSLTNLNMKVTIEELINNISVYYDMLVDPSMKVIIAKDLKNHMSQNQLDVDSPVNDGESQIFIKNQNQQINDYEKQKDKFIRKNTREKKLKSEKFINSCENLCKSEALDDYKSIQNSETLPISNQINDQKNFLNVPSPIHNSFETTSTKRSPILTEDVLYKSNTLDIASSEMNPSIIITRETSNEQIPPVSYIIPSIDEISYNKKVKERSNKKSIRAEAKLNMSYSNFTELHDQTICEEVEQTSYSYQNDDSSDEDSGSPVNKLKNICKSFINDSDSNTPKNVVNTSLTKPKNTVCFKMGQKMQKLQVNNKIKKAKTIPLRENYNQQQNTTIPLKNKNIDNLISKNSIFADKLMTDFFSIKDIDKKIDWFQKFNIKDLEEMQNSISIEIIQLKNRLEKFEHIYKVTQGFTDYKNLFEQKNEHVEVDIQGLDQQLTDQKKTLQNFMDQHTEQIYKIKNPQIIQRDTNSLSSNKTVDLGGYDIIRRDINLLNMISCNKTVDCRGSDMTKTEDLVKSENKFRIVRGTSIDDKKKIRRSSYIAKSTNTFILKSANTFDLPESSKDIRQKQNLNHNNKDISTKDTYSGNVEDFRKKLIKFDISARKNVDHGSNLVINNTEISLNRNRRSTIKGPSKLERSPINEREFSLDSMKKIQSNENSQIKRINSSFKEPKSKNEDVPNKKILGIGELTSPPNKKIVQNYCKTGTDFRVALDDHINIGYWEDGNHINNKFNNEVLQNNKKQIIDKNVEETLSTNKSAPIGNTLNVRRNHNFFIKKR